MRRELEVMIEDFNWERGWDSDATKIPCMAHVIQLVVKAILAAFKIKPGEGTERDEDDSVGHFEDDGTVVIAIQKASHLE